MSEEKKMTYRELRAYLNTLSEKQLDTAVVCVVFDDVVVPIASAVVAPTTEELAEGLEPDQPFLSAN